MSIQISKLRQFADSNINKYISQDMQQKIKTAIAMFIIWLQDVYIAAIAWLYWFWIRSIVYGCGTTMWLDDKILTASGGVRFLRAVTACGTDITLPVWYFYMSDEYKTTASLFRWLTKFGKNWQNSNYISIIFMSEGKIYVSAVDISDDKETISENEIPSGDISLTVLLNKKLCKELHNCKEKCQCSACEYNNREKIKQMIKQLEDDQKLGINTMPKRGKLSNVTEVGDVHPELLKYKKDS